jgi:hypothetical protein
MRTAETSSAITGAQLSLMLEHRRNHVGAIADRIRGVVNNAGKLGVLRIRSDSFQGREHAPRILRRDREIRVAVEDPNCQCRGSVARVHWLVPGKLS